MVNPMSVWNTEPVQFATGLTVYFSKHFLSYNKRNNMTDDYTVISDLN